MRVLEVLKFSSLAATLLFMSGCKHETNLTVSKTTKSDLDGEADQMAHKIADLTVTKCDKGYYIQAAIPQYRPELHVKALGQTATEDQEVHFLGYQWNGMAEVESAGYQIFKRGGTWYYRSPAPRSGSDYEPDVPIDLLESRKAGCPKD